MSTSIKFEQVRKDYDKNTVISNLNVMIKPGELFTLLGPSGCGKTTLLRMIAGFHSIDGGTISFDDQSINDIPAHKRNIGMVFQNYAIFPHMTVYNNVKYGLKNRKISKQEMIKRLDEIIETVQITAYKDRLPNRLSGGQQQRVALARAIVIHPKVLLMDEPLSNLDAKLRIDMRRAISEIQRSIGITTVYVTHDQEEALAISDRIAVMKDGFIQQVGYPDTIYLRPFNAFVATFIGHSNLFTGTVEKENGTTYVHLTKDYRVAIDTLTEEAQAEASVMIAVRPEEFTLSEDHTGIRATVKHRNFLGKYINYELVLDDGRSIEFTQDTNLKNRFIEVGEVVHLEAIPEKINVFTADGETSLIAGVTRYVE
ncbi:ABC transporter ATP-binding protein [Fictibacillus phosphorivorans]|uniref:ABC transporter ATP-binding protein n=1 Tax=Fictibacillus phosphorivorans TaxID=1221500 RepID=UPI00204063AD|nr:ABC transporter ATP-binding protein [Fictibacillus phosphorivorans]MCM3718086.1 ABC transporter ATP-binding protein [Fictibacillus phosphorivorans]MCM3775713.1 ABC transporter ATP-binding protein [Fictibacillus phosphorivorans]